MKVDRIVFFDLETGGLDPDRHPIIQLAAIAVETKGWKELEALSMRILFDAKSAETEALAMNHYDPELWRAEGIAPSAAMERFSALLKRHATVAKTSKAGKPYKVAKLAGHNAASFDGPFIRAWYKRLGAFLPADFIVLCTLQLAAWRAAVDETRIVPDMKLATACAQRGIVIDKAHDALSDVRATCALAKSLLQED